MQDLEKDLDPAGTEHSAESIIVASRITADKPR
jgi:hypothetical protein